MQDQKTERGSRRLVWREKLYCPRSKAAHCSAFPQRKVHKCFSHLHSDRLGYPLLLHMVPSIRQLHNIAILAAIFPGTAISLAGHTTLFVTQPSLAYTTVKCLCYGSYHKRYMKKYREVLKTVPSP